MTALAMRQKGLKPATKIVLYWLADHHNGETGDCFPSQKRLAQVCEMTDRSIRNQIEALKHMGLIEVIKRNRGNGSQTSNVYRLMLKDESDGKNFPTPPEKFSTPPRKNFPTHNLGNNNLGNKPSPLPPKGGRGRGGKKDIMDEVMEILATKRANNGWA
jgi:DNA-binding transcriptional MocR family regulator